MFPLPQTINKGAGGERYGKRREKKREGKNPVFFSLILSIPLSTFPSTSTVLSLESDYSVVAMELTVAFDL